MAKYDQELLEAARQLIVRHAGQRGRLPSARVRRSISTSYYALFHFLLDETATRIAGSGNGLRIRRRVLSRTVSHRGMKTTLTKVRGASVDPSVSDFLCGAVGAGPYAAPAFAQNLARAFLDAQAKREDADYDLNKSLSETDARLLRLRVKRVITRWRAARTQADRDFKHALCLLVLLKGQLRNDQ